MSQALLVCKTEKKERAKTSHHHSPHWPLFPNVVHAHGTNESSFTQLINYTVSPFLFEGPRNFALSRIFRGAARHERKKRLKPIVRLLLCICIAILHFAASARHRPASSSPHPGLGFFGLYGLVVFGWMRRGGVCTTTACG